MKIIHLSNSPRVTFVDDDVFELLSEFTWRLTDNGYAAASIRMSARPSRTINMYMHRVIMGAPDCPIDHRDRNKLNNQSSNLRRCVHSENHCNVVARATNKRGLKGVFRTWAKRERYAARIVAGGVRFYLGTFKTPQLAARAYNDAALKHHGEFACLNQL